MTLRPPRQLPSTTLLIVRKTAFVDALLGARQDVRPEEGLVGVDADPPDLLLPARRRARRDRTRRRPGRRSRAAGDLIQRELLALRLVVPVGRVAVQGLDPRQRLPGAGLVARDEAVDRRLLEAADRADRGRVRALGLEAGELAGEVARLLLLEQQADDVRRRCFSASSGRRRRSRTSCRGTGSRRYRSHRPARSRPRRSGRSPRGPARRSSGRSRRRTPTRRPVIWIPSSRPARFRPSYASWLKPRSLSCPTSVTSATRTRTAACVGRPGAFAAVVATAAAGEQQARGERHDEPGREVFAW